MGHWHMYYTGVKCTSFGGFGLTEGQVLGIASLFATSVLGQDFWSHTVKSVTLIIVIFIELLMVLFALVDTLKYSCSVPRLKRLRELVPLAQFIGLSYAMTYTEFCIRCPALGMFAMSLIFYLQNGKLVLASVTETKMALFHLDLVYLWLPLIPFALQKMGVIGETMGVEGQMWGGYLFVALTVERTITCSLILVKQVTKYLGYGFFEVPPRAIDSPQAKDQ
eukprot:TRINITY_DN754_c0_g1_i11.p1 TRINITY_DN754_c0_g1~~TRINITY_DN754_c0_g1_i11.p1  ORF type:complete len:222 (+),score=47.54 TRINITY_DN754_c0_g1_i11:681-1346(+)